MSAYKYQMHTHTLPCSDCSVMQPAELIESLYHGGYQGCVLTNHFYNGNTGIDRSGTWSEFVAEYEKDYIICKKEAEKYDMDLLFGIEEGVDFGVEVLCYGVTPEILYAHPELKIRDCKHLCDIMHSHGVVCIQAHPFRERHNVKNYEVLPLEFIDGIEVMNASDSESVNSKAAEFASLHDGIILVTGADAHDKEHTCFAGIETQRRIANDRDLVDILKSGNYALIK